MKKAMFASDGSPVFSDVQVAALRMLIASAVLLPFAVLAFRKVRTLRVALMLLIVGSCGNFFPAFLFTYSETGISSGYAGMLNSCTPIFALIIGFVVFRQRLTPVQIAGVAVGAGGVIWLMLAGSDLAIQGNWTHIAAVVAATFFYAVSLNTIKYTLQHFRSIEITALAFSFLFFPALVIAWSSGAFSKIVTNPHATEGLTALGILSVVGTALAVLLFNRLVAVSSVLFASSITYLIPVFAVLIGVWFGEHVSATQVLAMGVVLGGVFLANLVPTLSRKNKR